MFQTFRLGRVRAPIPRGAPSLRAHAMAAAQAPAKLIRDHLPFRPDMGGNDSTGDCTCAAVANAVRAQAAIGGYQVNIPADRVVGMYSAVTGYDPAKPETDAGAIETDVLAWQALHGFDAGGQTPFVGLWATIEAADLNLLRVVTARLGCGYLGLNLALADQEGGGVWDTDMPASAGDPAPGSWGGHAALLWSWTGLGDTDTVQIVTWGRLQRASWRWVRSRLEEAHALVHPQMCGPGGMAGIDRDTLAADVAAFGSLAA